MPRYDFDGTTLIGSIHIARNITARKEAEKEQKKLQSQLLHAQKLESVGQLAAGIALEINSPTQYVGTNLDFIDEAFHDVGKLVDRFQALLQAEADGNLSAQQFQDARQALGDADWEYLATELPSAINQSITGRDQKGDLHCPRCDHHQATREPSPLSLSSRSAPHLYHPSTPERLTAYETDKTPQPKMPWPWVSKSTCINRYREMNLPEQSEKYWIPYKHLKSEV